MYAPVSENLKWERKSLHVVALMEVAEQPDAHSKYLSIDSGHLRRKLVGNDLAVT